MTHKDHITLYEQNRAAKRPAKGHVTDCLTALQNDIEAGKIHSRHQNAKRLKAAQTNYIAFLNGKRKTLPALPPLAGTATAAKSTPGKPAKPGRKAKVTTLGEIESKQFSLLPFTGVWKSFFGEPERGFKMAVWGPPKNGKSYFSLRASQYFTRFGKVLYVATEEGASATFKKKLDDLKINTATTQNWEIGEADSLPGLKELLDGPGGPYAFVFIDSFDHLNADWQDYMDLVEKYPSVSFCTIHQVTKGGTARGSNKMLHDVDILVQVRDGVAESKSRYGGADSMYVFPDAK